MSWVIGFLLFSFGVLVGLSLSAALVRRKLQAAFFDMWPQIKQNTDYCLGARGSLITLLYCFGLAISAGDDPDLVDVE